MRCCVDACVPQQLLGALRALGADVISAAGRPGMPDEAVLNQSILLDRVLITADKDFGDLVFRDAQSAVGVVLIRFDVVTVELAQETANRIMALENDGRGQFTVLERTSTRIRRTPE